LSEEILSFQKVLTNYMQNKFKEIQMPKESQRKADTYTCTFCERTFKRKS